MVEQTTTPKPVAGQTLFFSYWHPRREGEDVTVTKVGRKWAELSNGNRIELVGWAADGHGYSSPGQAWVSRAAYEDFRQLSIAWSRFQVDVSNMRRTEHLSIATIEEARAILGLPSTTPDTAS